MVHQRDKWARILRRRHEDMWRARGLAVYREIFQTQRPVVLTLKRTAKRKHFSAKINKNATNPKALFTVFDHSLHRKKEMSLPNHQHPSELAESFSVFFQSKIARIRDGLDTQTVSQLPSVAAQPLISRLTEITPVTSRRRALAHSQVSFEVMWAEPHPDILVEEACGNPGTHNHSYSKSVLAHWGGSIWT